MAEVESLAAEANAAKSGNHSKSQSAFSNPTTFVARMPLHDAIKLTQQMPSHFSLSGGEDDEEAIASMVGYKRVSHCTCANHCIGHVKYANKCAIFCNRDSGLMFHNLCLTGSANNLLLSGAFGY